MKYLAIIFTLVTLVVGQFAFAGPGKVDSSAFNDIINENQKNEKVLQRELHKSVGIEVSKASEMGTVPREKRMIEATVEQITAKTSKFIKDNKTASYQDESDTMKRVAQEVKQAYGN